MPKKNLLIDEYPLLVLPSLAQAIGLNEAIALQQLHYWLNNPKGGVMMDGERWVYNTFEDWQKDNFPFWSVRTVMRTFANLEEMGLVISTQQASYDRKKYYRIHYDNLSQWNMPDCHDASCQDVTIHYDKVASSLTETTTETTTDIQEEPLGQISKAYEKEIGALTAMIADDLRDASVDYPVKWVIDAIHLSVKNNARNWAYVEAILQRWKRQGNQEPMKKNGNGKHKAVQTEQPSDDGFMEQLAEKQARIRAEMQRAK